MTLVLKPEILRSQSDPAQTAKHIVACDSDQLREICRESKSAGHPSPLVHIRYSVSPSLHCHSIREDDTRYRCHPYCILMWLSFLQIVPSLLPCLLAILKQSAYGLDIQCKAVTTFYSVAQICLDSVALSHKEAQNLLSPHLNSWCSQFCHIIVQSCPQVLTSTICLYTCIWPNSAICCVTHSPAKVPFRILGKISVLPEAGG